MKLLDPEDRQWLRSFENRLLFELYVAYLEARRGGCIGARDWRVLGGGGAAIRWRGGKKLRF